LGAFSGEVAVLAYHAAFAGMLVVRRELHGAFHVEQATADGAAHLEQCPPDPVIELKGLGPGP